MKITSIQIPKLSALAVSDVVCPKCGAQEMHPDGKHVLIRAFKVEHSGYWWSQCLVCAGYYHSKHLIETPELFKKERGWFHD